MENKNNKLLHALQNSGAENIFEAHRWLQQHRHELNKEAYGPVLLEVCILKFIFFLINDTISAYSHASCWYKFRLMSQIEPMLTTWKIT